MIHALCRLHINYELQPKLLSLEGLTDYLSITGVSEQTAHSRPQLTIGRCQCERQPCLKAVWEGNLLNKFQFTTVYINVALSLETCGQLLPLFFPFLLSFHILYSLILSRMRSCPSFLGETKDARFELRNLERRQLYCRFWYVNKKARLFVRDSRNALVLQIILSQDSRAVNATFAEFGGSLLDVLFGSRSKSFSSLPLQNYVGRAQFFECRIQWRFQ